MIQQKEGLTATKTALVLHLPMMVRGRGLLHELHITKYKLMIQQMNLQTTVITATRISNE